MYYPLFLDLSRSACLIIGGGEVGFRKAQSLLKAQALSVLVLDTKGFASWEELRAYPQLRLETRPFTEHDLESKSLVFACTGQKDFNAYVAQCCADRHILCNCVDAPRKGNCIVPALARTTGKKPTDCTLMAALSTEGASPAWSKVLRKELEAWLAPHGPMTVFLGRLRPLVLALGQETKDNTALFRALVHSPLREYLAKNDLQDAKILLQELLPHTLHIHIEELLY